MKGTNMVIAIALVALCLVGWLTMATQAADKNSQYNAYISQADGFMAEGLYQRAILEYKNALADKPTADVYTKAIAAYQARLAEVPDHLYEDWMDEYEDFLVEAVAACPTEASFVQYLGALYLQQEQYESAYGCMSKAAKEGVTNDTLPGLLQQARYAWRFRGNASHGWDVSDGTVHAVMELGLWGTYNTEDGNRMSPTNSFVGRAGENGTRVVTSQKDSRLIAGDGTVLGIFEKKIVDAGVYSDGLVAASLDGNTYHYYDEFAVEQFGGYQAAGAFQDGKAAVKQGNVWFLVDKTGAKLSEDFAEIVLDRDGKYLLGSAVLAAKTAGKYAFYDADMNKLADIDASAVGIPSNDGLVAFCKGGKWGFVKTDGTVVIQPTYEMARSFSNGLAAVCINGQWGFVNTAGTLVIEAQFTDVLYFNNLGVCAVRVDVPQEDTPQTAASVADGEPVTEIPYYEKWKLLTLYNGIVED